MKNETIVDRVVQRLKAQPLGDLITEEDLHDIVKEAIPKVFFEQQRVTVGRGSYNERTEYKDPAIVEIMRELLRDEAAKHMKTFLADNAVMLTAFWAKVLDQTLLAYVQNMQQEAIREHIRSMLNTWVMSLNDERARTGVMPLPLV